MEGTQFDGVGVNSVTTIQLRFVSNLGRTCVIERPPRPHQGPSQAPPPLRAPARHAAAATRIRNPSSQRPASMVLRRATCVPSEAVFFHYSSRRSYMLNARVLFRRLELRSAGHARWLRTREDDDGVIFRSIPVLGSLL